MWQRFTKSAQAAVFHAQEAARRFQENYVSTEHLLMGLLHTGDSVALRLLSQLGVDTACLDAEITRAIVPGTFDPNVDMQLTPRSTRVVDLAYRAARELNDNYIGTEHLLLGLIDEAEGFAGLTLLRMGITHDRVREALVALRQSTPAELPAADQVWPPPPVGQDAIMTALPSPGAEKASRYLGYSRIATRVSQALGVAGTLFAIVIGFNSGFIMPWTVFAAIMLLCVLAFESACAAALALALLAKRTNPRIILKPGWIVWTLIRMALVGYLGLRFV